MYFYAHPSGQVQLLVPGTLVAYLLNLHMLTCILQELYFQYVSNHLSADDPH